MSVFPLEIERAFRRAEEYWRRHSKSKAVKEAEKRILDRKSRAAGRKFARALGLGGLSSAGVIGYGLIATSSGPAFLVAGAAALVVMTATLAWPGRRATDGPLSPAELEALPGEAEEWLLGKRASLPVDAFPALDVIFMHLGDLQTGLGAVNPASTLAWEARRLIGSHLPQLVHAYCELPAVARGEDPEHDARLISGLGTIAEEMTRLSREVNRDRLMRFETQGRFLESRYREPDAGIERD
jgi:hypothetical protein